MTASTTQGLFFDEADLTYLKIGLERLAEDYDRQNATNAAADVRRLTERVNGVEPAKGMPDERHAHFQRLMMDSMNDGFEATERVLNDWYAEALQCDPNAARKLAPRISQQILAASAYGSMAVLHRSAMKLAALEKRQGTSSALQAFGHFLAIGMKQIKEGQELWAGDPDAKL